jgi:hypothetical protein
MATRRNDLKHKSAPEKRAASTPRAVVLGRHGRPKKGEEKGLGNTFIRGSTNAPYLLARLVRDRPELARGYAMIPYLSRSAPAVARRMERIASALPGRPRCIRPRPGCG